MQSQGGASRGFTGTRRLLAALAVLTLAGSAQAQEGGEAIQAVRVSSRQWLAIDAAQTRGELDSYQHSLGVVPVPESPDAVREPIASETFAQADVLLVEAPAEAVSKLQNGGSLREVLASVLGGSDARLAPAGAPEEEPKPTEHQLALLLPAGSLAGSFAPGQEISVERLLALDPRLVLDVRPESPCADKCDLTIEQVELAPTRLDSPVSLPPPDAVASGQAPEGGAAPLRKLGGPSFQQALGEDGTLRFHAQVGGSGDIYRWVLTSSNGERWLVGDTVRAQAVNFTLPDAASLDTSYQLETLVYSWNPEQLRWSTLREIQPWPGPGTGWPGPQIDHTYDVGVIQGQYCDNWGSSYGNATLYMDDEDRRNANNRWGWIGATRSTDNTQLFFCRVDGRIFKPLSTVNDTRNHYAVVKLGSQCPNGSETFVRHFDNEDNNNKNWANMPSGGSHVLNRNTTLHFCLFRNGSNTMSGFPNLNYTYGVFAAPGFYKALSTGGIYTDDEDNNNANSYQAWGNNTMTDAMRIISGGNNTTLNMVKVK
ncbi:hypothetical protein [Archangium sp.]|uniref:hypothetical protein n=1 Tax=Archangium sp. TaxID=1872627 RepID=UPI002ED9B859